MRWFFFTGMRRPHGLGAILTARPRDVAEEALFYVGYSEACLRARVQERRYVYCRLVSGFLLQLVGYA